MRQDDFEADTDLLADLTLRDLQEAQVDIVQFQTNAYNI